MASDVSGGIIVQDKNLYMVFDEENEEWNVPSSPGQPGELSADTAMKAVKKHTGCDASVSRYRSKLKTTFAQNGDEYTWQPYDIEIAGEPENGEWVPVAELRDRKLAAPLSEITDKLVDKL